MTTEDRSGWIYVLDDQLGHYKIGKTRHLSERIKQLKIQLPYKVKVVVVAYTHDCDRAESFLHRWLASYRVNGEWFALQNEDVGFLWSGLYEIDDTFSFKNLYIEECGKLTNYGWWIASNRAQVGIDGAVFYHFKNLCLDQACDDFNLPRSIQAQEFIAPTFFP